MENKLTQKEINKIIENHKHWLNELNEDVDGWDNMRANFSNRDLSGADLSGTNLSGAYFRGANLTNANLTNANLSNADLTNADLTNADFTNADLFFADFSYAIIDGTNFDSADFCNAEFRYANFFDGTKNIHIPMVCPEKGSFIGFKKAVYADKDYIVKLQIPADARRSSATDRICRCDKAKVLEIQNFDGSKANIDVVYSFWSSSFQYKAGQIVEEPNFDDNRFNECSKGIHFFISRQEAVDF